LVAVNKAAEVLHPLYTDTKTVAVDKLIATSFKVNAKTSCQVLPLTISMLKLAGLKSEFILGWDLTSVI